MVSFNFFRQVIMFIILILQQVMLNGGKKNCTTCKNDDRGGEERPKKCSNPEIQNSNIQEEERNSQSHTTGQSRNGNGDDNTEVLFNTLLNAWKKLCKR